ncbi:MAG: potassium/hydrogen antiporter [Gemmatimonadales bacterium]|jgi:cell volume regulation protein A|nr:potassium/hydrogen antiporter [Gemmatimonadales bacterium]
MTPHEPEATALLLATCGLLLGVSVLFSRASQRFGVPIALLFLVVGMLAGSEGIGGIEFNDYQFAFRIGVLALALILFDGGLNTPLNAVRRAAGPAGVLATVGVAGTATLLAVGAHSLGLGWPEALLLGAVVSSTDAAAVFAVLRGSGLQLKRRVSVTLEVESGINDPVAVILTTVLTQNLLTPGAATGWRILVEVVVQMAVGAAVGAGVGYGGRYLLSRLALPSGGLYPVMTLALGLVAFGLATLAHGSGFLAVYLAGLLLGNGPLPYRTGLLRVHDALAWLSQVGMFLILGLLVFPSRVMEVAPVGLAIGILLGFVVRPLVVWLCLLPFRYPRREVLYIGWVGLRGAVPIVLATFPVLAGVPGAERLFDLVFFIVVVNALVQGGSVGWLTRKLGLQSKEPPAPQAVLAIESRQPLQGELMSFYIDDALVVTGVPVADLPLPDGAAVALIIRGNALVPPVSGTALQAGDHVHVIARPGDRAFIQLMFGRPEEE